MKNKKVYKNEKTYFYKFACRPGLQKKMHVFKMVRSALIKFIWKKTKGVKRWSSLQIELGLTKIQNFEGRLSPSRYFIEYMHGKWYIQGLNIVIITIEEYV